MSPVSRNLILAAVIFAMMVLAYLPAMHAGFIWDDPDHIHHNQTLRSPEGLVQMWTDRRSLPQWYPLVHTTFWIEYQLWGTRPAGYHINNILLHAASAIILWRVLMMLNVPGAWLAAALFAVHPVHVESVAWITERKNVLSGFFYLLALGAYLRAIGLHEKRKEPATTPPPPPQWNWYAAALVLFLCALFSKTITSSLPAAILLIIWWKTGRIRFRDVALLLPFFTIGLILALNTAMLEQVRVGARGHEWQYGPTVLADFLARTIIAGKALWFYTFKLIWPAELAFIYERWNIDWRRPAQYLYPITALAVILTLFLLRKRIGRGPVVALLFFAGTLFPALGFFNVFPHRYSFVADHFQYHASIGLIVLAAALLARASVWIPLVLRQPRSLSRYSGRGEGEGSSSHAAQRSFAEEPSPHPLPSEWQREPSALPVLHAILAGLLLFPLAVLTYAQAQIYESPITLWDDTVRKSPRNWMAWTNLANALVAERRIDDAIPLYEHALVLAPHVYDVQWNAGVARARQGRYEDAERHFRRAVEIMPTFVPAWESLGDLYSQELNQPHRAVEAYRRALEIAPHRMETRRRLLETILNIEPDNEQVKEMLERMRR